MRHGGERILFGQVGYTLGGSRRLKQEIDGFSLVNIVGAFPVGPGEV